MLYNPENGTGKENGRNTQDEALSIWTTKVKKGNGNPHSRREDGVGGTSVVDGYLSLGVDGENRSERITSFASSIGGGILGQLIEEAAKQLAEDEACVEWYQEKVRKDKLRLEILESIQEEAQTDPPESGN